MPLIRCIGCGLPLGDTLPSEGALAHVRTCEAHPLAREIAAWKKGVEDANRISQREQRRAEVAEAALAAQRPPSSPLSSPGTLGSEGGTGGSAGAPAELPDPRDLARALRDALALYDATDGYTDGSVPFARLNEARELLTRVPPEWIR